MRKRTIIPLVLLMTIIGLIAWQLPKKREPLYQGRKLSAWMEDALVGDEQARSRANEVWSNLRPGDRRASGEAVLQEVVPHVIRALKTQDNRLWRPYTTLREKVPAILKKQLPRWREPQGVRAAAAYWLGHLAESEPQSAVPALCEAAKNDPSPIVRRWSFEALSNIGVDSNEALPIMLDALANGTDRETRIQAAEWFMRATPATEKAAPILIQTLQDPDGRVSEACAHL